MSHGNPMVVFFLVLGSLALLCCIAGVLVTAKSGKRLSSPGFLLFSTALLSVAVFGLTSGWLLHSDTRSGPGDAVRTGGLAAAAVLALYGLWLNDRRRRTEEERNDTERKRHEIEVQRNAQERERTAGERFARAIELLGNPDESVKLGALHSLVSLSAAWPDLVQPVLDVLCGHLRMPFDPVGFGPEGDEATWRAGQVRRTAQRLVRQTLEDAAGCRPAGGGYRLDLDGAVLYEFSLERVAVETISADRVECHGPTVLDGLTVSALLSLHGCHVRPRVRFLRVGPDRQRHLRRRRARCRHQFRQCRLRQPRPAGAVVTPGLRPATATGALCGEVVPAGTAVAGAGR
ncbi:MAG: hypothetical protein ACRDQ5_21355 [Sciscionella sp.]